MHVVAALTVTGENERPPLVVKRDVMAEGRGDVKVSCAEHSLRVCKTEQTQANVRQ